MWVDFNDLTNFTLKNENFRKFLFLIKIPNKMINYHNFQQVLKLSKPTNFPPNRKYLLKEQDPSSQELCIS